MKTELDTQRTDANQNQQQRRKLIAVNSTPTVSDVSGNGQRRLRLLDYIFILLMFTVNLQEVLEFLGEDSILKPYRVIALVLGIFALTRFLAQWSFLRPIALPLMFAYSYALVMTFLGGRLNGVLSVVPMVVCNFALFIAPCVITSKRSLYLSCYAYIAGLVVSIVLGFFHGGVAGRFSGMFANPNYFGYACCIAIIFLMAPSLNLPNPLRVLLILSLFTFVFLTGSRSSLVSTIAAFLSQIVRNPRLLIAMIIATVMIVIASLALESNVTQIFEANQGVARRYTEEEIERGGHGRLEIARAAFTVGVENLFLGIGIDQFRQKHFTRFFQVITRSGELKRMGVHNTYITILTEWGALAFIACGLAMFRTYRVASLVPEFKLWIHGFLWSGLVIGLASHVVGTPHFWLILGFCLQSLRLADRRPGSPVGQRVDFRTPSPGRVTG